MHQLWAPALALAILMLALGLRLYSIGWSLPYTDHPDEPPAANRALGMLRRGDWDPQFFGKPSLYYYALRLVFAAHLQYGVATGLYNSIDDLPVTTDVYLTTPQLFIWGRAFTILLGLLTVAALYLIARRGWGAPAALVAAALLAVLPFHMRHSQYLAVDVPSAFLALLGLGASLRILDGGAWRSYALAGLFTGLAAATKYNGGAVALAILAAHGLFWGRASLQQLPRLFWGALWGLGGFLLGTPYALLEPDRFFGGLLREYYGYAPNDAGDLQRTWPIGQYLREFVSTGGMHPLPFAAALLGMAVVVARHDRPGLVLLAFTLPYPLVFLAQSRHFFRNMMPIFPPLVLLAGIGTVAAGAWLAGLVAGDRAARLPARAVATLVLAALLLAGPLWSSIGLTMFYARPHSKVEAGAFVHDDLPHGAPIAVTLHPAQFNDPFVVPFDDVAAQAPAWYRAQGFRFLVVDARDPRRPGFQQLRDASVLVRAFPGDRGGQPGPRIEVLDLGQHLDELAIERQAAVFGEQLQLLGYQSGAGALRGPFAPLDGARVVPRGQALLLNLYWLSLSEIAHDYAIFLHLVDSQGNIAAQLDLLIRQGDHPTSQWHPQALTLSMSDLPIPAELPPGQYTLRMGLYRMDTMQRLVLPGSPDNALDLLTVRVE